MKIDLKALTVSNGKSITLPNGNSFVPFIAIKDNTEIFLVLKYENFGKKFGHIIKMPMDLNSIDLFTLHRYLFLEANALIGF